MKGFVAAIVLLICIVVAVSIYGVVWRAETEALYERLELCVDSTDTNSLEEAIAFVDKKRSFWHLTLRQGKVFALQSSLNTALFYCKEGNTEEMNRCIADSLDQVAEWQEVESFSLWATL